MRKIKRGKKQREPGRELWDGRRLREVREFCDLTQTELTKRSGVRNTAISRHETNADDSNPSIASLCRLAQGLGVRVATLFDPVGSPIERADRTIADGHGFTDSEHQKSDPGETRVRAKGYSQSSATARNVPAASAHEPIPRGAVPDPEEFASIISIAKALAEALAKFEPGEQGPHS